MTLQINNINSYYGSSHILQNVSLSVDDGAMVSVLGRNGVGKSTLLKSIVGLNPPREGTIKLNGKDITNAKPMSAPIKALLMFPKAGRLFPILLLMKT